MKYKAVIWETRNGHKCNLYRKVLGLWIPIEFVRWHGNSVPDSISFLITEKIEKWVSYYKDKIQVVDPRPNKIKTVNGV